MSPVRVNETTRRCSEKTSGRKQCRRQSTTSVFLVLSLAVSTVLVLHVQSVVGTDKAMIISQLQQQQRYRQLTARWLATSTQQRRPSSRDDDVFNVDAEMIVDDKSMPDVVEVTGVMSPWLNDFEDLVCLKTTTKKRNTHGVPDLCRRVCSFCHQRMSLTISTRCTNQCIVGMGRHFEACYAMWMDA